MTFEEFAEIPTRMHAFYSQAFDTLFQKHDALKSQFVRETRTSFTKDQFKRCLAAFCAMSYLEQQFSFKDDSANKFGASAIRYVKESSGIQAQSVSGADFVYDVENCVCLLQPDGLELSFVHRSFQEYFTALFAANYHDDRFPNLLDRFARKFSDSVVSMTFDIAREKVEHEWVKPRLLTLQAELSDSVSLAVRLDKVVGDLVLIRHGSVNQGRDVYVMAHYTAEKFGVLYCITRLYPRILRSRMWFLKGDKYIPFSHIGTDARARDVFDDSGANLSEWYARDLPKTKDESSSSFRVRLDKCADWLVDALGFGEPLQQFVDQAPKVVSQIDRKQRARKNVLDEFF